MQKSIEIPMQGHSLKAIWTVPKNARAVILFSHGSGSGRLSPRNQFVAEVLQKAHFATLLVDLLSEREDQDVRNRFNIDLLTERLVALAEWLKQQDATKDLDIGLFGASTGAAAALRCSVKEKNRIGAVVSRGGRPDLALPVLDQVTAPTLLIVGGEDTQVISLNEIAYDRLNCQKKLEIIEGATHLFEEPGTLEEVARLARNWFESHL